MNKIVLSSLSMDLKRVALGLQRGSNVMADRFAKEALKRRDEIDTHAVKPYIQRLLSSLEQKIKKKSAEDLLMYSILFQNAALKEQ